MNLYNVKNIKDLPQLEQILPGNFLVVENFTGTNKLDFDDFVIGPRNTSFANQVFNDIKSLSSYSISLSSTVGTTLTALSSNVDSLSTNVNINNSQILELSAIATSSSKFLIRRSRVVIPQGSSSVLISITIPSSISTLYNSDFNFKKLPLEPGAGTVFYAPKFETSTDYVVYSLSGIPYETTPPDGKKTHFVLLSSSKPVLTDTSYSYTAMISIDGDIN